MGEEGNAYVDAYGCGFEILECAGGCLLLLLLLLLRDWSLGLRLAWYWGSLGRWGSAWVGKVVPALALGTTWVSIVVRLSLVVFPSACEDGGQASSPSAGLLLCWRMGVSVVVGLSLIVVSAASKRG